MRSVNKVILIWNVVHDPETKQTWSWHSFTSFVLATNREWFSSEWSNQSLAEFHKIVAWWKLADLCWKFLRKWKFIYIEWYLKTKVREIDWKKMYRTEVVAQDMIMLNKKSDTEDDYEEFDPRQEEQAIEVMKDNDDSKNLPNKEEAPVQEPKETPKDEKKSSIDVGLDWDDI